ncbi:MAG: hypothetical protein ACI9T7_000993 [Oleiphilaceae bacterium]|jgi:hypothetical protein
MTIQNTSNLDEQPLKLIRCNYYLTNTKKGYKYGT